MTGGRTHYRPSGRADQGQFVPLASLLVLAAGGAAWLLWRGWETAFYAPLLFSIGAATVLGALGLLVVRLGRCRSPGLALLLGLVVALLVQPGPFVLAYLDDLRGGDDLGLDVVGLQGGAEPSFRGFLHHFDARLAAADLEFGGMWPRLGDPDGEGYDPGPLDHWVFRVSALLELLLVPAITAFPLWIRVRREPFCEVSGRWMDACRVGFFPHAHEALLEALVTGRLIEVARSAIVPIHPNRDNLIGVLHSCPDLVCSGPAGYLSLHRSTGEAAAAMSMEVLFPWHRCRPRCALLERTELDALAELIPGTGSDGTATIGPDWIRDLSGETGDVARLEVVTQTHPPPAVDERVRRWAEWIDLGVLLSFALTGFGLLAAAAEFEKDAAIGATPLGIAGFALMAAGLPLILRDRHFFADRWILRRHAERLRGRPGARVRPEDPDAVSVRLVPRSIWNTPKGQENLDVALLAARGDRIFVEGDRLRMEIPAASIFRVTTEKLVVDQYWTLHLIVLEVRGSETTHTLPWVRIGAPLVETLLKGGEKRSDLLLETLVSVLPGREVLPGGETQGEDL